MKLDTIKEAFGQLLTSFNSIMGDLEEPWKTHFENLKGQYNSVLAALQPTDQAPAALEASSLLTALHSSLLHAQSLVSLVAGHRAELSKKCGELTTALASATSASAALEASLPEKIQAAIDARIKAGELVPKDTLTSLCSEAKLQGEQAGEQKVRDELAAAAAKAKVLTDRKAAVQTAGLPLPEDALLEGTDEEFTARQTVAATRVENLRKLGVSHNSATLVKAWLPADQYDNFEKCAAELLSQLPRGRALEPFAGPAGTAPATFPGGCV